MTEKPRRVESRPPAQRGFWNRPERFPTGLAEMFGEIASHEWFEWDDWEGRNERSYSTFVPMQESDIEAVTPTDIFGLRRYLPRLHLGAKRNGSE